MVTHQQQTDLLHQYPAAQREGLPHHARHPGAAQSKRCRKHRAVRRWWAMVMRGWVG